MCYTAGLDYTISIASDPIGNMWIANYGDSTYALYTNSGTQAANRLLTQNGCGYGSVQISRRRGSGRISHRLDRELVVQHREPYLAGRNQRHDDRLLLRPTPALPSMRKTMSAVSNY